MAAVNPHPLPSAATHVVGISRGSPLSLSRDTERTESKPLTGEAIGPNISVLTRGSAAYETKSAWAAGGQHRTGRSGKDIPVGHLKTSVTKDRVLTFSLDPADYEPRCVRCHRRYDGAAYRGERCLKAKLTESDVTQIRDLLKSGHTAREVSKQFGVTQSSVWRIRTGGSWAHLPGAVPKEPHGRDKTHCKRGHPFDEKNTRLTSKGRVCRACRRRIYRQWWRRKKVRATR